MKELKMYIDGRFIENQSDKWIDVLNPSTEEVISKMPDGTPEDARAAINAAVKAQLSWESLTSIERAGYLGTFIKYYKISQLIHTQSIAN